MKGGSHKSIGVLALFLVIGAVVGGIMGEIIADMAILPGVTAYLVKHFMILDVPPVSINLYVIKFVIGFALYPNLISILGIAAAAALFRRF